MSTQFALDLRLARRKAGYTQRDVAHLLGVRKSVLSDLERGRRRPSLRHIVTLSVIYGRSFESLFGTLMSEAEEALRCRIMTIPGTDSRHANTFNRGASIERLARRLANEQREDGDA